MNLTGKDLLAAGAVMARATPNNAALNGCAAAGTGLASTAIGCKRARKIAGFTIDVDIQRIKTRSPRFEGGGHHRLCRTK